MGHENRLNKPKLGHQILIGRVSIKGTLNYGETFMKLEKFFEICRNFCEL